ncbi:MAG: hypothetical protein HOW73_30600 [Polyangiaceae bacterium]|nr:hypothetical protein [Polyangiaceae bacterium]
MSLLSRIHRTRDKLVWTLGFAAMIGMTGCDPGWGIKGTVEHDPAVLGGDTLIIVVAPTSTLDERGLPVRINGLPPGLALATTLSSSADSTSFDFGDIGCREDVRVLAWVDADHSEDWSELDGRTLTSHEERTELHERIASLRPTDGDWVAVSEPFDFPHDGVLCEPSEATADLVLAPLAE